MSPSEPDSPRGNDAPLLNCCVLQGRCKECIFILLWVYQDNPIQSPGHVTLLLSLCRAQPGAGWIPAALLRPVGRKRSLWRGSVSSILSCCLNLLCPDKEHRLPGLFLIFSSLVYLELFHSAIVSYTWSSIVFLCLFSLLLFISDWQPPLPEYRLTAHTMVHIKRTSVIIKNPLRVKSNSVFHGFIVVTKAKYALYGTLVS